MTPDLKAAELARLRRITGQADKLAELSIRLERCKPDPFGPWADGLDPAEKLARYRGLRALAQVFAGPGHPLVMALARAEVDSSDEAAGLAWEALMTLPTIRRRRILGSLATLIRTSERKAG